MIVDAIFAIILRNLGKILRFSSDIFYGCMLNLSYSTINDKKNLNLIKKKLNQIKTYKIKTDQNGQT